MRKTILTLILMTAVTSALLLFGGGSAIEGWMVDTMWDTIRLLWKVPDFAVAPALPLFAEAVLINQAASGLLT